jgi:hypothetical protein
LLFDGVTHASIASPQDAQRLAAEVREGEGDGQRHDRRVLHAQLDPHAHLHPLEQDGLFLHGITEELFVIFQE